MARYTGQIIRRGHAPVAFTLEVYSHVHPSHKNAAKGVGSGTDAPILSLHKGDVSACRLRCFS